MLISNNTRYCDNCTQEEMIEHRVALGWIVYLCVYKLITDYVDVVELFVDRSLSKR